MPTPSSGDLQWFGVNPDELDKWWPMALPFMERVAEIGDFYKTSDVRDLVADGKLQLWIFWDGSGARAAGCTLICNYPRKKSCLVKFFAADEGIKTAWIKQLTVIENWAKEQDCELVEIIGRPGWKRVIPDYRLTHVVLRKDL